MSVFPVYQDVVEIANLSREQLPFFMRHVTVYKRKRLHHHEFSGSSPGRNALIRAKLAEAIVLYIRSRPTLPDHNEKQLQLHPKHHFWEIIQYIHNHYMDDLDSSVLSEQFGVSASWIQSRLPAIYSYASHAPSFRTADRNGDGHSRCGRRSRF